MINLIKSWLSANKARKQALDNRALNLMMQFYLKEFHSAGRLGLSKPICPNVRGLLTESHKKELDDCYMAGLKWQAAYNAEMAKPQWNCVDPEIGRNRIEQNARQAADIADGQRVWAIK